MQRKSVFGLYQVIAKGGQALDYGKSCSSGRKAWIVGSIGNDELYSYFTNWWVNKYSRILEAIAIQDKLMVEIFFHVLLD